MFWKTILAGATVVGLVTFSSLSYGQGVPLVSGVCGNATEIVRILEDKGLRIKAYGNLAPVPQGIPTLMVFVGYDHSFVIVSTLSDTACFHASGTEFEVLDNLDKERSGDNG